MVPGPMGRFMENYYDDNCIRSFRYPIHSAHAPLSEKKCKMAGKHCRVGITNALDRSLLDRDA